MRRLLTLLATSLLLVAALATAQTDAAMAADYTYPLLVEDEEGDQAGIGGTPGDNNPENDILAFEVTDDATTLVFRLTMATLDFGVQAGQVVLSVQLTGPNDEDWEATVTYEDGGENLVAGEDFSSGGQGDDDEPVPGMYAEADAENAAIYMFFPHEDTGMAVDDTVTFTELHSGRGAVLSSPNRDTVDVSGIEYTLAEAALEDNGGEGPDVEYTDLEGEALEVDVEADEATTAIHVYNWTSGFSQVLFAYDLELEDGNITVNLADADNRTLFQNTLRNSTDNEVAFSNATAGGWALRLDLQEFQGNIRLTVGEDGSPTGSPTSTQPAETNGATGTPDDGDGNGTPGPALVVLLAGIWALAWVRRRI